MTVANVQRLVQRVRQKPDGRATIKVRTLLSTFGYSRRSPENVRDVQQQLAAEGITVELSVSSPASLDERIALVLAASQAKASATPGVGSLKKHAVIETSQLPVHLGAETPRASEPNSPLPLAEPVRNEQASPNAVEKIAEGRIEAEPPRSFAARLFRTALSLFDSDPPTILALQQNELGSPEPGQDEVCGDGACGRSSWNKRWIRGNARPAEHSQHRRGCKSRLLRARRRLDSDDYGYRSWELRGTARQWPRRGDWGELLEVHQRSGGQDGAPPRLPE
jgi:hypothetical protein